MKRRTRKGKEGRLKYEHMPLLRPPDGSFIFSRRTAMQECRRGCSRAPQRLQPTSFRPMVHVSRTVILLVG